MTADPPPRAAPLTLRLDAALPQMQCRRCGHDGCRPYAEAIAGGDAINRCAPGGDAVIATLATLTRRPAAPLDPAHGVHGPLTVATIDEARCIGCTLCIEACPVDAIVGAARRMHVVVAALCAGCDLCVAPCPVDCIAMVPAGRAWTPADARAARGRYDARERRRAAGRAPSALRAAAPTPTAAGSARAAAIAATPMPATDDADRVARREAVAAALARARARRAAAPGTTAR